DQREVLQAIGHALAIRVAVIVGGDASVLQIDAQSFVGVDAITADALLVRGVCTRAHHHTRAAVEGDSVAQAAVALVGIGAADDLGPRILRQDAAAPVTQVGAAGVGADVVVFDAVVHGFAALDVDAPVVVAGDDVGLDAV